MLMRFRGGGVGHRTTREATNSFLNDRDPLDIHHASAAVAHSEDEGSNDDESDLMDDEEGLARGKAMELDEGDKSDLDHYDDYGYSGVQQEVEEDEDKDEDRCSEDGDGVDATEGDGDDEIDDELGAEDGEDSDEELEGFSEF
ncbi:uncharacterized protein HD556DRAFT_1309350 [Suillus plorans]|uniref:Uncharacterized protein n=1 Tax=Suillus plorans TaxID=116603 RepID=A0A9P7DGT0_9AGAM|nr:uncharacterized protein HD556DRAFT_1309350 [Suillus plorans]KAG1792273.1 hypothetical protein HD556DRAFT_1309350 [Suillus plorans]